MLFIGYNYKLSPLYAIHWLYLQIVAIICYLLVIITNCLPYMLFIGYNYKLSPLYVTRIIQSLYYAPAGRYINAWMHSLKKSVGTGNSKSL
jgi:hypothetical protein